jgi:hypothetical protein
MKERVARIAGSLGRSIGLDDKNVIYFEGGLGSQILGLIRLLIDLNIKGNQKVRVDLSYFKNDSVVQVNGELNSTGLSLWKYQLDAFGYSLKFLEPYSVSMIYKMFHQSRLGQGRNLIDSINLEIFSKHKIEIMGKIPAYETERILKSSFGSIPDNYAVVHLRRGDYLNVALNLVSETDVLQVLEVIKSELPQHIVFISDSAFDETFMLNVREILNSQQIVFRFDIADSPISIHSLMRNSSLLVMSNSTFSFSAGLLSDKKQKRYIPKLLTLGIEDYCTVLNGCENYLIFDF